MSLRAAGVLGLLLGVLSFLGCQRASRYPGVAATKPPAQDEKVAPQPAWSWQLPQQPPEEADVPIVFIAHGHKDWAGLPEFWNVFPPPAAGMRTIHLGQSPLGIAGLMVLSDRLEVVKIKVPLGLPDPTPNIPAANPPTFAKWKLGRQIFFARKLAAGPDTLSCATCHQPNHGFAEDRGNALGGSRNSLSLINSAYQRHQFWDGRAIALEEVVVRSLEDELSEQKSGAARPQETHRWGGLVRALDADLDFRFRFEVVFGLKQPTQDAVAKAMATYLRTILSSNSLYDRAEQERSRQQAPQLRAEHFTPFLDAATLASLQTGGAAKDAVAKQLIHGHRLFREKGCVICHPPPFFTDYDFHNVGVGESSKFPISGEETGRFVHVPIGLKETRLIGAFRTPSLRALPRTAPYFHDGTSADLRSVVKYFNHGIDTNLYLAEPLRADARGFPKSLDMDSDDQAALVTFLRALDGDAVDRIVAGPK